jgi:hypothetical protein
MKYIGTYETHPDNIYKKVWELLMKDVSKMTEEEKKNLWKKLGLINNFNINHINLANTTSENLQTQVIELTNDIIEQYNCNTTLEKSLCEVIANSYGKIMEVSKKVSNQLWAEYLSKERSDYLAILSKELDRENRNYLNSLNNLIELKRPIMNINIKTKNAFIWQNQQFNNNNIENENFNS